MKLIRILIEGRRLFRSIMMAGFVGIALVALIIAFVHFWQAELKKQSYLLDYVN